MEITIKEINRVFKSQDEIVDYILIQNQALQFATNKIKDLESQAKKLQVKEKDTQKNVAHLITRSIPEALCQIEIDRMMQKVLAQPLDFEDVKKLDILIKNYYLAKEKEAPVEKQLSGDLTDDELLQVIDGSATK